MEIRESLTSHAPADPQAELRKLWRRTIRAEKRARDALLAQGVPSDLVGMYLPRSDWSVFAALRCGARTKATGQPCKLKDLGAGGRCRFHGGLSTGPKTPEGRARSAQNGRRAASRFVGAGFESNPPKSNEERAVFCTVQRGSTVTSSANVPSPARARRTPVDLVPHAVP